MRHNRRTNHVKRQLIRSAGKKFPFLQADKIDDESRVFLPSFRGFSNEFDGNDSFQES